MSEKAKFLPKKIYVYQDVDSDGSTFLIAEYDERSTATPEESRFVGEYTLGTTREVDLRVRRRHVRSA